MSFDFDAGVHVPHRMQPGLRRLAPGTRQLTPAVEPHRGVSRHLREKLAVLSAFRGQALLSVPGFDAAPALAVLAAQAAAEHPQALRIGADGWQAPGLGWALDDHDEPCAIGTDWPEVGALLADLPRAWRRPALLSLAFAEDFAILDGASGTLPWLAVALPSMWAPEQKVGRHFAEAHAPVADNRLIVGAAAQLVKLVTGGPNREAASAMARPADAGAVESPGTPVRWERFVWTLTGHPRLHAHPQRVDPALWPTGLDDDALAAQTWWRTERQTFIPVPDGGQGTPQAVFTIQIEVTPLARAFARPEQAARVHDALASMSAAVLAYRGLVDVQAPLLRWLGRQAAGAGGTSP